MLRLLLINILFFVFTLQSSAQEFDQTVTQSFLIIQSTKDYDSALRTAKSATEKIPLVLKLRGLYADMEEGLNSDEVCGCGLKHGYISRGRYDDGAYVSIEYSDAYTSFTQGYYVVMVASGKRNDLKQLLPKIKEYFTDAYIKDAKVYMGCMH